MIQLHASNAAIFTGRRNSAMRGWRAVRKEMGLQGMLSARQLKKKWDNLKEKYRISRSKLSQSRYSAEDPSKRHGDLDPTQLVALVPPDGGGHDCRTVHRQDVSLLQEHRQEGRGGRQEAGGAAEREAGSGQRAGQVRQRVAGFRKRRELLNRDVGALERDRTAADRDRAAVERDRAFLDRDRAFVERDRLFLERAREDLEGERALLRRERAVLVAMDGHQAEMTAEKEVVLQTRFYQSLVAKDLDPEQLETRQRLVSLFQRLVEKL